MTTACVFNTIQTFTNMFTTGQRELLVCRGESDQGDGIRAKARGPFRRKMGVESDYKTVGEWLEFAYLLWPANENLLPFYEMAISPKSATGRRD